MIMLFIQVFYQKSQKISKNFVMKCISLFEEEAGPTSEKVDAAFEETATKVTQWEKDKYKINDTDKMLDKQDLFPFITALFSQQSRRVMGFFWVIEMMTALLVCMQLNAHLKYMWSMSLDPLLRQEFYDRYNFLTCYKWS